MSSCYSGGFEFIASQSHYEISDTKEVSFMGRPSQQDGRMAWGFHNQEFAEQDYEPNLSPEPHPLLENVD